jgi:secreted protein with Ig-like and vWFA domain
MTEGWRDWFADSPGWEASGQQAEFLLADGTVAHGVLLADEFFDGENEIPVFEARLTDGRVLSPHDAKGYRLLPKEPQ